jgi:hypothetical protein
MRRIVPALGRDASPLSEISHGCGASVRGFHGCPARRRGRMMGDVEHEEATMATEHLHIAGEEAHLHEVEGEQHLHKIIVGAEVFVLALGIALFAVAMVVVIVF